MGDSNEILNLMLAFPKKTAIVFRLLVSKYMKDSRLKSNHLTVLYVIGTEDGISQKKIGAGVPYDKSYISTTVKELIEMGLVVNKSKGKLNSLKLTESGKDMRAMTIMLLEIVEKRVTDGLTNEEKVNARSIITKLNNRIDEVISEIEGEE